MSGLLNSLPPPRASTGGGKETGRSFIPYSLTKHKPRATTTAAAGTKSTSSTSAVSNRKQRSTAAAASTTAGSVSSASAHYSDSDDDAPTHSDADTETSSHTTGAANFFSLDSEPQSTTTAISTGLVDSAPYQTQQQQHTVAPRLTAASLYNMSDDRDTEHPSTYSEDVCNHDNVTPDATSHHFLQDEQVNSS